MAQHQRIALISVSNKTGVVEFAAAVAALGFRIVSTGGTAKALREGGLDVTDVSALTGFPELMDGRVKTLHPVVHAGLLAVRDNPDHMAQIAEHGIEPIDLVVVNLYPFERTVAREGVTEADAVENIDIGGPTMIRAAAKNFWAVTVVVDPADYDTVLAELRDSGQTTLATRRRLARKVFETMARYNGAIAEYLLKTEG
ncbi:MAG: IMP cyclohydrolase [candidate division WS1 bacterium]|nr:IMP cyclohydrolase [candidate division WS1 bacterium]